MTRKNLNDANTKLKQLKDILYSLENKEKEDLSRFLLNTIEPNRLCFSDAGVV